MPPSRRLVPTCNSLRSWRRGCSLVPSFWSRQIPAIRAGCIGKSIKKIYSWFAWYVASVESYSSFGASIFCTSYTASIAGESAFARWECGVKEASLLRGAVCVLLRIELPCFTLRTLRTVFLSLEGDYLIEDGFEGRYASITFTCYGQIVWQLGSGLLILSPTLPQPPQ